MKWGALVLALVLGAGVAEAGTPLGGGFGGGGGGGGTAGTADPNTSQACAAAGAVYHETDTTPNKFWVCRTAGVAGAAVWDQLPARVDAPVADRIALFDANGNLEVSDISITAGSLVIPPTSGGGQQSVWYEDTDNGSGYFGFGAGTVDITDGTSIVHVPNAAGAFAPATLLQGGGVVTLMFRVQYSAAVLSSGTCLNFANAWNGGVQACGAATRWYPPRDITVTEFVVVNKDESHAAGKGCAITVTKNGGSAIGGTVYLTRDAAGTLIMDAAGETHALTINTDFNRGTTSSAGDYLQIHYADANSGVTTCDASIDHELYILGRSR